MIVEQETCGNFIVQGELARIVQLAINPIRSSLAQLDKATNYSDQQLMIC